MMDKVKRCEACVRRGRSCDGSGMPVSQRKSFAPFLALLAALTSLVDRILQEQRRLKEEEKLAELSLDEAQRNLEEAQRDLMERLARLRRLR